MQDELARRKASGAGVPPGCQLVTQNCQRGQRGGFGAEDIAAERRFFKSGIARGLELLLGPPAFRPDGQSCPGGERTRLLQNGPQQRRFI